MSQATERATRREIRRALGPAGMDVVRQHETQLQTLATGLGTQLYQAHQDKREAALKHEALEYAVTRLGADVAAERSARLKLADEQRRYVDNEDRLLQQTFANFRNRTFWQRLRWLLGGA